MWFLLLIHFSDYGKKKKSHYWLMYMPERRKVSLNAFLITFSLEIQSFLSLIPACRCYNSTKKNWKRYRRSSEHFWALLNSAYCSCSSTALTLAKGFEQEVFPLSQNFTELNNAVTGKLRILKDSEHGFQKLSWCSLLVEGKKKPTQTQTNKTQEFCVYDFLASLIPPCPSSATSNISLWIPVALKIISCSINWK